MEKKFSNSWIASKQPRKQRKYVYNAPLHVKSKMIKSHLTKELREKYHKRSVRVVKGDKIKVMVGQFKNKIGKVENIDIKTMKIYVTGIERVKKDGSKSMYPLHASNLLVTELNLNDKKRKETLERNIKND